MYTKFLAPTFIFIINFIFSQSRRYDNYTLYNVVPVERDQLKFLQNLEKTKYIDVLFWSRPYRLYNDVQLLVNPTDLDLFKERLEHFKLDHSVLLRDVQRAFDDQTVRRYMRLHAETFSWDYYHSLEDIYQWLADIAMQYPKITELKTIGKSAEGRDIFAIAIKRTKPKGRVIVDAGIHGNEWISIAYVTYLIKQLVQAEESNNKRLKELAWKYNWILVPVLNPDGFDYSLKVDRMWRKNRRNAGGGVGVDLNRNFNHDFGRHGSSNNPNDEYYCGPSPFSESESVALQKLVNQKRERLMYYFSFHGYGQKIIIPYGDRIQHIDNFAEVENYGKQAILKMYKLTGVKYGIGTMYDMYGYRISGNSAGWVKKSHKLKYAVTFYLRDNGSFGYALPTNQILPTCRETMVGMLELMTAKHRRVRANLFNNGRIVRAHLLLVLVTVFK